MEAVIEGGVEVAGPPAGAGRRGTVPSPDWPAIVAWCKERPWRWFRWDTVPSGDLSGLRKTYPGCRFESDNTRLQQPPTGKAKRVCSVYVCWTGEP
jgi:hypothetical protein